MSTTYLAEADHQTKIEVCEGKLTLIYSSPECLLTNMMWRDVLQVMCTNKTWWPLF